MVEYGVLVILKDLVEKEVEDVVCLLGEMCCGC